MQDDRIDAAFLGLKKNMPRAPEALVERMVRTVNALEAERTKRKGTGMEMQAAKQKQRTMTQKQKKPPELGAMKPPGMR